jgi:protoporphyrinogen oxidase
MTKVVRGSKMKIGIVGGGLTGITIAQLLTKKGHEVVVYESKQPGGLAGGIPFPYAENVYLDRYYHHIFKSDTTMIQLIREYGLLSDLLWFESKSGIYADGRHWEFRTPFDLLRFSPLGSLWQRFLMGINLYYFRKTRTWGQLDTVTCRNFFEQRKNIDGYKNLWEPLLKQKFADEFDNIPASFLWGRISPRLKSTKNGKEYLGYLRGGFYRLILEMVNFINASGGVIRTDEPVHTIVLHKNPRIITNTSEDAFDRVVWTISLGLMRHIIQDLPPIVERKTNSVQDIAVTCLILVMNKRQSNYYWLNNIDPDISFGAVIEHTNLVPLEYYSKKHIVYVINYHKRDYFLSELNKEEILNVHLPSLHKVFPGFSKDNIVQMYVSKDPYSCPVFSLNFSKKIPPYQGWLQNVDICNMAQVYPVDRNMNHCVQNALNYVALYY